jgi:AraC-like DNA-binding protein
MVGTTPMPENGQMAAILSHSSQDRTLRLPTSFPVDDVVSELLRSVRIRSSVYCRSQMTSPWGFRVEAKDLATFHLVLSGECLLEVAGDDPLQLASGDLVILPTGRAHQVRDDTRSSAPPLEEMLAANPMKGWRLQTGGGGAATELLCGGFLIEDRDANPLLAALPPLVQMHGLNGKPAAWLAATVTLLDEEMNTGAPGYEAVVTSLADVLLTQAVRAALLRPGAFGASSRSGIRDPQIGAALRMIHELPERRWTVDGLAAAVAMSRAAFASRFKEVIGEPPGRYLLKHRLEVAADWLRTSNESLHEIARRIGYESDVSLSKAFRKHFLQSPGAYRREARARGSAAGS